ncbi:MAG TPA: dihydrofolate reductase family protein, partial [Pyrinomonadaceae bacterium]|nr:dihydrofolate reductase family protein [Pyrinomonadaceae bacterium]
ARHRPLVRVVLDDRLQLTPQTQLAQTARTAPVIVYTTEHADERARAALTACGVEVARLAGGGRDLRAVLADLYARTLHSLFVEGGATVAGRFLDAGLVEKISFMLAPVIIGGAGARMSVGGAGAQLVADATRLRGVEITRHGDDVEITGYPHKQHGEKEARPELPR